MYLLHNLLHKKNGRFSYSQALINISISVSLVYVLSDALFLIVASMV